MYRLIIHVISLLLLGGCSEQMPQQVPLNTVAKDLRFLCPVKINGHTLNFLLDTGSTLTVINNPQALKAGLLPTDSCLWRIGLVERIWIDSIYTSTATVKIANMSFQSEIVLDNYRTHIHDYQNYDGILGLDILSQIYWMIDLKKNVLSLSFSKKNILKEINPDVTFEWMNNLFYTKTTLGGSNLNIYLDTGCLSPTKMGDYEFSAELAITNDALYQCEKDTARMVSIEAGDHLYILYDSLNIDKINIPYTLIDNTFRNNPSDFNAVLTRRFLDHFDYMIHDAQEKKIYLYGYNSHISQTEDLGEIHLKIREGFRKGTVLNGIFKKQEQNENK